MGAHGTGPEELAVRARILDASKNRSYDLSSHSWFRLASRATTVDTARGGYANIYREAFEAGDAEEFTNGRIRR